MYCNFIVYIFADERDSRPFVYLYYEHAVNQNKLSCAKLFFMLKPKEQFICDQCGQVINSPEEGYVEWLDSDDNKTSSGFRIVHQYVHSPLKAVNEGGCYKYNKIPGRRDVPLDHFLEIAQTYLLSFLDKGIYVDSKANCRISDFREYTEFARRLTIPYYEEARFYMKDAYSDNEFDGCEMSVYTEETFKYIIEKYANK